jgi:hypothetical protein
LTRAAPPLRRRSQLVAPCFRTSRHAPEGLHQPAHARVRPRGHIVELGLPFDEAQSLGRLLARLAPPSATAPALDGMYRWLHLVGTFLPFVALRLTAVGGYRRHVADGAGRPSLTRSRHFGGAHVGDLCADREVMIQSEWPESRRSLMGQRPIGQLGFLDAALAQRAVTRQDVLE